MKTHDRASSLFWLLLAVYVCVQSVRLGIGTPRNPGMGFMTFGSSVLWGIFALILFFKTFLKREEPSDTIATPFGSMWKKVVFVVVALVVYATLLTFAGYLISTFLFMTFLFWIVKGTRWWWVLGASFLATVATYYFFSKCLNCQFPEGVFGF